MDERAERILRSIASSLQQSAQAQVQINNRLAEIGKELKKLNSSQPAEAESPLGETS